MTHVPPRPEPDSAARVARTAAEILASFSASYAEARARFLAAAADAGAEVRTWTHPDARGPDGGSLAMDVAIVGDPRPARIVIVLSGTHGVEGYTGSAVQCGWLRSGIVARLAPGAAVAFVHAVNPWGFAHGERGTEHGVDLNRNFVEFPQAPANAGYAELHPHLAIDDCDDKSLDALFGWLDSYRGRVGEQAFSTAFNGGQYEYPDGLFYGGSRPQWSNIALREVLREVTDGAAAAVLVDLHTGIGAYGKPFFLNFDAPGSPVHERLRRWWGERAVSREGSTHRAFARYQGLLLDAFEAESGAAERSAVAIEFGTRPRPTMQRAHVTAMWRRRHPGATASRHDALRREYREAFYPGEDAWRLSVAAEAASIGLQTRAVLDDARG